MRIFIDHGAQNAVERPGVVDFNALPAGTAHEAKTSARAAAAMPLSDCAGLAVGGFASPGDIADVRTPRPWERPASPEATR